MKEIVIRADALSVGYSSPLISDISFTVKKGEIVTLIGPNGAGKSTILKTLSGEIKKLGGKVILAEGEFDKIKPRTRAKKMSVLLTERVNARLMTCREVVESGRYPHTGYFGICDSSDLLASKKAMELVNIQSLADTYFDELSDGQKQRVMLARAICREPEILILDEPVSYLDLNHKLAFLEILRRLADESEIGVIMSMHELDFAREISDKTICVKGGKIHSMGTPEEIFTEKNICDLFDINADIFEKYLKLSS